MSEAPFRLPPAGEWIWGALSAHTWRRIIFPSLRWSATRKLSQHGGDFSGKIGLKGAGGFCHEKEAVHG